LRLLIFRSIRSDELCDGGESAGHACPKAQDAECIQCGHIWQPDDTGVTGACPECQGWNIQILRCEGCPVEELSYVRSHSHAGRLFERVLELEFDSTNFSVPWADVTAEEVKGLQILKDERDKYQRERAKRDEEARRNGIHP
jgi:predicted RNA-binding Zn-ribbon protein involved in translation (DUF1610 family)